ncbi:MAG: phosphoadenosine phosphosulfate reductase domain-containing protein [Candidatus Ranarchaeia archaeon]
MPIPYFGRIQFSWCPNCNVPLILTRKCAVCNTIAIDIPLTPPGEVRPVFDHTIKYFRKIIDENLGNGFGDYFLPKNHILLFNRVSAADRMEELIVNGQVLGKFVFDTILSKWKFQFTFEGAKLFLDHVKTLKKIVIVDADAVPFIAKGANVLGPGVIDADTSIKIGDDVVVVSPSRKIVAIGTAKKKGEDMVLRQHGIAVKPRKHRDPDRPISLNLYKPSSWKTAVNANRDILQRKIKEAQSFIRRTKDAFSLPVAVAFSGGKDSLATFLLTRDVIPSQNLFLFFADTGIEFPEIIPYIHEVADKYNLSKQLIIESANGRFWKDLQTFGPPARDYRWCCKTCKLAPINRGIETHFPNGVLTFVGQRRYESRQRSLEKRVNKNPWVPGQIRALPIRDWPALLVWLFLFKEKAPIPPPYLMGYERVGCWLCPANKMADFELLKQRHPALMRKWTKYLATYQRKRGLPSSWVQHGLWRWKSPSNALKQFLLHAGISIPQITAHYGDAGKGTRAMYAAGVSPCRMGGFTLEGRFSKYQNIERVREHLHVLGTVFFSSELSAIRVEATRIPSFHINLFADGSFTVRAESEKALINGASLLVKTVIRALDCTACGICIQQCQQKAIYLKHGRSRIDTEKCNHCLQCLNYCPLLLNRELATPA